jgi:CheY-like chemotaxis protein
VGEDDSPIRAMLADLLEDAGYAVAQATDCFQALKHLRQQKPDLLILDLMLPGVSGWEFLDGSRAQLEEANIPVLVLSAISSRGDYPATLGVPRGSPSRWTSRGSWSPSEKLAGPSHTHAPEHSSRASNTESAGHRT